MIKCNITLYHTKILACSQTPYFLFRDRRNVEKKKTSVDRLEIIKQTHKTWGV